MALRSAQSVAVVYRQSVEQRVVDSVKVYLPVPQKQSYEFAVLHHGAEVARSQSVAIAPEFHRTQSAENEGVERHDADIGIVSHGCAVVELLGVVVLHV